MRNIQRARSGILFSAAVIAATLSLCVPAGRAQIVVSGAFGPNGDVGFVNSPPDLSISFGSDGEGSIYQMDAFVNVAGQNLNNTGSGFGTSADLSYGSPAGLAYSFSAAQPTADQLVLTYSFVNNTGASLPGFQFLAFVDPDIGPNYADEWATVAGSPGPGGANPNPESFQVGDPTYSTIFTNLLYASLSNVNEEPSSDPGDVSMAVGFAGIGFTNRRPANLEPAPPMGGSGLKIVHCAFEGGLPSATSDFHYQRVDGPQVWLWP